MNFKKKIREEIIILKTHPFVKDSIVLQVGALVSLGMSIIFSVVLVRLVGPSLYGQFILVIALVSTINIFSILDIDSTALVSTAEFHTSGQREKLHEQISIYCKLHLGNDFLFAVLTFFIAPIVATYLYGNKTLGLYAFLVVIPQISNIFFDLLKLTLQITRKIKLLVFLETLNVVLIGAFQILFVVKGFNIIGLILGQLGANIIINFLGGIIYFFLSKRDKLLPSYFQIARTTTSNLLGTFIKTGASIGLDKKVSSVYALFPTLFLGKFSTTETVALFKIAFSYATLPIVLLSGVSRLLNIQFPQSKVFGRENLRSAFIKASLYSGVINVLLLVPAIIIAQPLIAILYGGSFIKSVPIIYLLAITLIPVGFTIGFGSMYRALGITTTSVKINLLLSVLGIAISLFLINFLTPLNVVILVALFWAFVGGIINWKIILSHISSFEKV